jgi:hypothetical protein
VEHLKDDFYVVAVISNPERYETRYKLFRKFMDRMEKNYRVNLYVVELAYGDRSFEITSAENPRHIQLRSDSALWHKENMINIGISRLPSTWKYVAWIDGDIDFVHPEWVAETIHELQHHPVVQLFEDAIDLGPDNQVMTTSKSFAYCYKNKLPYKGKKLITDTSLTGYYSYAYGKGYYWHPGYAWAATREAINTLGGLFELGIVGAGDHHMACSLVGEYERSLPKGVTKQYKMQLHNWADRAARLHKNIGFVKGTIYHYWHGKKRDRRYKDRWSILIDNKFDPIHHVHKDWQGLLTLYPGHDTLRDEMRQYFQSRNEDSIDML